MKYWLFEEPLQIDNKSTDYYWRYLLSHSKYEEYANICLRIASIGLTEAEVERMFSLHKSMLSQNVTNLGTETLHNRCILHICNEDI